MDVVSDVMVNSHCMMQDGPRILARVHLQHQCVHACVNKGYSMLCSEKGRQESSMLLGDRKESSG